MVPGSRHFAHAAWLRDSALSLVLDHPELDFVVIHIRGEHPRPLGKRLECEGNKT